MPREEGGGGRKMSLNGLISTLSVFGDRITLVGDPDGIFGRGKIGVREIRGRSSLWPSQAYKGVKVVSKLINSAAICLSLFPRPAEEWQSLNQSGSDLARTHTWISPSLR